MEQLGRADAVDDVEAEAVAPAAKDLGRQRFAGRDADPQRRQIEARLRGLDLQHAAKECRHAEEDGRPPFGNRLEGRVGPEPLRDDAGLGAEGERKRQAVAEAVGEEQLRGRQHAVVLRHAEHAARIAFDGPDDVVLQMDHAFGAPVLPEL